MNNQHIARDDAPDPGVPDPLPSLDDDIANTTLHLPRLSMSHVLILSTVLLEGIGSYAVPSWVDRNGPAPGGTSWLTETDRQLQIVVIFLIIPIVVAVHELGHLAAGRLLGFQFLRLIIGPLRISRQRRGLRVEVTRRFFSGAATTLPRDDRDLLRKRVIIVAAGPVASLLLAVALGILFLVVTPPGHHRPPIGPILLCLALGQAATFSFVAFLGNSFPVSIRGVGTDGQRIATLLRGGPRVRQELALAALHGQALEKRPRDWDAALVTRATQDTPDAAGTAQATALAYLWALDSGKVAEAARYIEQAMADQAAPPSLRAFVLIEASFFSAFFAGDPRKARALWEEVPAGLGERHMRLRAEAALLLAEGQATAAQMCAQARPCHSNAR